MSEHNKPLEGESEDEVERYWNVFWRDLLTFKDGSIDIEQVKKELYDFKVLMYNSSKVYNNLSGGIISHPMTDPDVAIQVIRENLYDEFLHDHLPEELV